MAFAGELRQSTAVDVLIGPFVEDSDGDTPTTGLTLDVELSKNGQGLANKTDATAPVHDAGGTVDGYYNCELDATDTGTLGNLTLVVHHADALPVRLDYSIVTANYWDSKYSTDKLEVDLIQMGGVAQSATDLKDFADAGYDPATNKVQGVVLVDTTTTNTDMAGTNNAALASVLGAAVGASISADIADLPTVAEFEARSIVSADYVVVGDTIAGVTLVDTCTTNTDMEGTNNAALASVLGAAVGASISADIAAVPTVTEFNARTLASADYVVTTDTIAGVTLVDTCTTNTDMAGANNAALASVLGAAVGASISADIADLPTVAEFEARTIVSADYVVVGDTLARVTLVDTCTTNTDVRGTDGANTTVPDVAGTAAGLHGTTDTLIADVPTVAEFNARTIVSADYLVEGDTLARVTLVDTCTTNTDLVSAADIVGTEVDNDGTAISLAGALKLCLSALTGKSGGGGTANLTFRDIADTKTRIAATVDATGRTAIGTRDGA